MAHQFERALRSLAIVRGRRPVQRLKAVAEIGEEVIAAFAQAVTALRKSDPVAGGCDSEKAGPMRLVQRINARDPAIDNIFYR